jgi:hypothetical protein
MKINHNTYHYSLFEFYVNIRVSMHIWNFSVISDSLVATLYAHLRFTYIIKKQTKISYMKLITEG